MEVLPGVYIKELLLWIPSESTLVVPDIHLGYEDNLRKKGVIIPREQYTEALEMFKRVLAEVGTEIEQSSTGCSGKDSACKPDKIVFLGDIKHEFGNISSQEWSEVTSIFYWLSAKCKEIILLKGNHDKIIDPIAKKVDLETRDHILIGDYYLCHGDFVPPVGKSTSGDNDFEQATKLIMGHEHPAITIRDEVRSERYKCFLLGKYNDKDIIVMPSMNPYVEGTDILRQQLFSPLLQGGVQDFRVFVVADKTYDFGRVDQIDLAEGN